MSATTPAHLRPEVCAVVLNWNRPEDTLDCLNSLVPLINRRKIALVVCDNASSDDSVHRIARWADEHFNLKSSTDIQHATAVPPLSNWDYLLVQTGANRGYAGGNNIGIRYALERNSFKYIWILNNDTLVHADALDALEVCARHHEKVGVFGSTIVDSDARDLVHMAGGFRYNRLTTVISPVYGGRPVSEVMSLSETVGLDYVSGAAMFCRSEVFREVGLFDERYFLYYEELDLAHRMKGKGYSLSWCKNSIVYHKGGASTGEQVGIKGGGSWVGHYNENLSTLLYTQKNHPAYLPVAASARLFGKVIVLSFTGRIRSFGPLIAAYWDALTGRRRVAGESEGDPVALQTGVVA